MHIPRFWARRHGSATMPNGRERGVSCCQWSDLSMEDAHQRAANHLLNLTQRVRAGAELNRYAYGDRPMREEVVQAIEAPGGREIGLITSNAYGAFVLNAANAMFIDIDFVDQRPTQGLLARVGRLFGKAPSPEEEAQCLAVRNWWETCRDLGVRVYRTCAGLRCLITTEVFDPTQSTAISILQTLGSDPLYVRLCQSQKCFRARLTPKPWRCGLSMPPVRYPWDNDAAEQSYRQWQKQYERAIAGYTTCRLIETLGPEHVHPDVEPILRLHDEFACAQDSGRLA